jgi:hypothetical protein
MVEGNEIADVIIRIPTPEEAIWGQTFLGVSLSCRKFREYNLKLGA